MPGSPAESQELAVLTKRSGVLARLADSPAHKRDLVDELDQSRSTINRAIGELEEVDLVRRGEEGFVATSAGRLALDRLEAFRRSLGDVVDAEPVLAPLSREAPLPAAAVTGSEATLAADPNPYRALEGFHDGLAAAGTYRALLPALDDPRHVRLLYEHVVTDGRPAELVVSPSVFRTLRAEFPRRLAAMAATEGFSLHVGDVPPFALGLVDADPDGGTDGSGTVHLVVFTEHGGVHGTLHNGTAAAVRWAGRRFEDAVAGADDRTDLLAEGADAGGEPTAGFGGDADAAAVGQVLPVALDREGFVRPSAGYFRAEPVADPTTAWRAGLTLPEVHAGYAVERTFETPPDHATDADLDGDAAEEGDAPTDASEAGNAPGGSTGERRTVSETVLAVLDSGTDCVVVGPPGSGKSTVCKRVACEWYDADRGPVFYREGGRGRPFESVDSLLAAADAADGTALVVVEDAVRPDADAVFDAADSLADRDDVRVLLDAREGEWRNPPGEPGDVDALSVVSIPPLDDHDTARIVSHFERTTGESVGPSPADLRAAVQAASAAEDAAAPGGMLLLLHRLSTYADPLATGRTSLEAEVANVYEEVAGDGIALDVCVLASALNAAGRAVSRGVLYAAADGDALAAVDDAIERLDGRVLFESEAGTFRTVHESWSAAFLERLADVEGEALAAERFGDVVTALLALADDPAHRDRVARHVDDPGFGELVDDPGAWATDTADALYALARDRPKLAALFGSERPTVALPEACPRTVEADAAVRLGHAHVDAGDLDAAEGAFERLPDDESARGVERRLGLSLVAERRGAYDEAVARAEEAHDVATALDEDALLARTDRRLGEVAVSREDYETARPHLRRALDGFEAVDDRRQLAGTLDALGTVARRLAEYDAARAYHERSRELSGTLGDRRGQARSLANLGSVALDGTALDDAREYYEASLELHRRVGNRDGAATVLENLGLVARHQGEYGTAREYHERSRELSETLGDPQGRARSLGNLGLLAKKQDDYEAAVGYYEETLAIHRDLGLRHGEAKARINLAEVAVQRGDAAAAREHAAAAEPIFDDLGDAKGQAIAANVLGAAAREEDAVEEAVDVFRRSVELFRSVGIPQGEAVARRNLGEMLARRGDEDAALGQWETALETFESVGAPQDALETLEHLVEATREAGEEDAAARWLGRARETAAAADDAVAAEHREWIAEHERALEAA